MWDEQQYRPHVFFFSNLTLLKRGSNGNIRIMSMPSSVVHYTSLPVLQILLTGALASAKGEIVFHLSHLSMMNDSGEGRYILDRFYTDSLAKKKMKEDWNNSYYPSHLPFIFSTIATDTNSRNRGSIPMWKMYGDECRGVLLRFNYSKLKKYCAENKFIFDECKYRTVNEVDELIAGFNKNGVSFDELMLQSCITKQICWSYEKEWRIIVTTSNEKVKTKSTARGLVEYFELHLPIDLIEEICLGPLCEHENSEKSIALLKEKLVSKFGEDKAHFDISKSSITLK